MPPEHSSELQLYLPRTTTLLEVLPTSRTVFSRLCSLPLLPTRQSANIWGKSEQMLDLCPCAHPPSMVLDQRVPRVMVLSMHLTPGPGTQSRALRGPHIQLSFRLGSQPCVHILCKTARTSQRKQRGVPASSERVFLSSGAIHLSLVKEKPYLCKI